jgi:N-acetylmuramoyl-L-alanine amidase-like protein
MGVAILVRRILGVVAVGAAVLGLPAGAAAAPRASDFSQSLPSGAARAASSGATVLPAVRAPHAFDLLGVKWRSPAKVSVDVRSHSARTGRWSPWVRADGADDAPDSPRAPFRGTGPVWTGRSDRYQLRLSGPARGVRVQFVRAHVGKVRTVRPSARAAAGGQPTIIPRSQWAGDQCNPKGTPSYGTVQMAFVHHTAGTNNYGPGDSAAIVLAVCRFHRDGNGWNDIGYNFLVDKYGQIFEGRAGGIDQPVIGAQAQGYNDQSTGISSLGTFGSVGQTDAGLRALGDIIGWKLGISGVPTTDKVTLISRGGGDNRYPSGTPVTFDRISGHRDADATDCPGDALYAQLPDIRSRAAGVGPVTPVTPGGPTATTRTVLSLAPATGRLSFPQPVSVAGKLTLADGTPVSGVSVRVQVRTLHGHWVSVTTATTGPDGSWSANVNSSRTVVVRAYWPGDATHRAVASSKATVKVQPTISLAVSARRVAAKGRLKLSGAIAPRKSGVGMVIQRRVGAGWRAAGPRSARARGGKFSVVLRPTARGLYRARATFGGDARNPKASSPSVFFRVA